MDQKSNQQSDVKVIDFAKKKRAKMVLDAFDRLQHEQVRNAAEKRAEVERTARNKL